MKASCRTPIPPDRSWSLGLLSLWRSLVSALIPTIGLEVHCQLNTETKCFAVILSSMGEAKHIGVSGLLGSS